MKWAFFCLLLVVTGCREPYFPPVESIQNQLLVVEANLDPGNAPTSIRLSRTTGLNEATFKAENNATIIVEGKDNTTRPLVFSGNGVYSSPNLNLVINNEYRLRIRTSSGKEYLSDYVKATSNPPLDSISWERNSDGVQIHVNTNDPTNGVKYFRWDYSETWEIRSYFSSELIYKSGLIRNRIFPDENITTCWKYSPSTRIMLANSEQLQSGIISKVPVVFIPEGDEKLFVRYSVSVKQYALDKAAYNFFEILKKNTEDIGSFFGPQPAEIKGNLQCISHPGEPVIGFVTASEVNEKRIFISHAQLVPRWPNSIFCDEKIVPNNRDSLRIAVESGYTPVVFLGSPPDLYVFGSNFCVDCTYRGGSNKKPSFW